VETEGPIKPLPTGDVLSEPTAAGARRIFMRFVLVAVGVNVLIGAAVVVYNVYDSLSDTHDRLEVIGEMHVGTTRRLKRASPDLTDEQVMRRASALLDVPMALFSTRGALRSATSPAIAGLLPQVFGGRPARGTRVDIGEELGQLSGAWVLARFTPRHDLLVVVRRLPEEEGLAVYMTIAAGITGLAIAVSFLIMLAAANWMLRRPLNRLVNQLTGALARDVQRRRQAEEVAVAARREAEKHLAFMNSLIDASEAVGIVAVDEEGLVQIFNWGAARILGHDAGQVVGRMTLEELRQRPGQGPDPRSPLLHPGEGEEFWVSRDGTQHLLYVNDSVIHDSSGAERGRLVTFIDVTEQRKLQAELQLNELQLIQSAKLATLGEMATGIAHELNQPLNNIGLLSSRVQRRLGLQPLDEEERSFYEDKLAKIQSQVERAGKIIDHLRAFGRPSDTQLASIDVRKPIEGVMVFLREQLVRHDIEIKIEIPPDTPRVHADEARLEQVLMNLIVNARDALDEVSREGKQIRVGTRRARLPAGEAALGIEVADNGPGMPPEVVERIFEPFFSTKEVGKGTGLGLSISYGLVRDFGGVLEVESNEGQGTTFTVLLRQAGEDGAT